MTPLARDRAGGATPEETQAKFNRHPEWKDDMISGDLHNALRAACADVGIVYRDVPADGRFHVTDVEGDRRGRGDGRIKLFADGTGGLVVNWKGETRSSFFAGEVRALNGAERAELVRKPTRAHPWVSNLERIRRAVGKHRSRP